MSTRDLERELQFMCSKWSIRIVDIEAFLIYREANLRFKQLERSSPGALKAYVDARNPEWKELVPEPAIAGEPAEAEPRIELRPSDFRLPDAFWNFATIPR